MLKTLLLAIVCTFALLAFCEPSAKYEVATIVDVKPHQPQGDSAPAAGATYDVYVRVANTVYVVLYTDTMGTRTVKYVGGREALVHVGKDTITYNDISGESHEVPIISRKPFTTVSQSK